MEMFYAAEKKERYKLVTVIWRYAQSKRHCI